MAKLMIRKDDEIFGREKNEILSCKVLIREGVYTDDYISKTNCSTAILLIESDQTLILGQYKKAGYWIIIKPLIQLDQTQLKILLDLHAEKPVLRLKDNK